MKKALLALLCVIAIVVTTVFGTLAYLTDKDANVNTFTVGDIDIKLDEKDVDNSTPGDDDRDQNNAYHLLPGITHEKDPMVTVFANSEDCYVRMIVTVVGYDSLKSAITDAEYYDEDGNFLLQKLCVNEEGVCTWNPTEWECVSISADGKYEFRYKQIVTKTTTDTALPALFTHITVPGTVDNDHLAYLDAVDIKVDAYAIQAAGFDDAAAAWSAYPTT